MSSRSRVSSPAPKYGAGSARKAATGVNLAVPSTTAATTKDWRPEDPIKYAPLFQPSEWGPIVFAKFLFGWPGYLWPWNCIYLAVCVLTYIYTTPNMRACYHLPIGCNIVLYLRNLALLWVFAGGWHYLLYQKKVNGLDKKYDPKWQATESAKFLFGDQTWDNVFWSCTSGVAVWSAYEALFIRLWGLGRAPVYYDWWSRPYYSAALLLAVPIWREFHFYWTHRLIHWKPLYRWVHYLHHKNTNPGPWSGLSMHPVEHILYFSVVLIHMVVPSHPVHFFFNAQHTALTPSAGHHGFHGPIWDDKLPTGSYFHYLHHRYFECNYGEATIPLDRWFGTFHNGKTGASADCGGAKASRLTTGLTMLIGTALSVVPLGYAIMKLDLF